MPVMSISSNRLQFLQLKECCAAALAEPRSATKMAKHDTIDANHFSYVVFRTKGLIFEISSVPARVAEVLN